MINPKSFFNFHAALSKQLMKWKLDPNTERVILSYGLNPSPWAELRSQRDVIIIPLPTKPDPYGGWRQWLKEYLEDQIAIVAEEVKVKVVVLGSKGNHFELYRKESVEEEV